MNEQISLFDLIEPQEEPEKEDDGYLDEYALVYLVTKAGGWKGNLFILSVEDAKKLCSDKCSQGRSRNGSWMFQWTTIRHFVSMNDTYDGRLNDFEFIWDTGKQDKDFERLGIKKPSLKEQCELLHKMGYVMTWPR